jgi:hypothetical protein
MSIEENPIAPEETLRVLNALAAGVNPLTGQPLPDESIYQHARILRALQSAIASFTSKTKNPKKAKREGLPPQAGKPWTAAEDALLVQGFENRISFPKLAEKHQRTRGSILSRLAKLGKIDPDPNWAFKDAKQKEKRKLLPGKPLLPPRPAGLVTPIPDDEIPF